METLWPEGNGRPLVFLVDASSIVEQRLLHGWIERNRVPGVRYEAVCIPPSRKPRRPCSDRDRLGELLADDPLFVPLRVAWLAPRHHGRRSVSFVDLFRLTDPRVPDPIRQLAIVRHSPDRCWVVVGEPATASSLRRSWKAEGADGSFVAFVHRRASLALERAERRLRGNRYKIPRFVRRDILTDPSFVAQVRAIAEAENRSPDAALTRASRYLKEIAASHSPYLIDLVANAIRWLYRRGYRAILYSPEGLANVLSIGQRYPLVFLPSHKSNLDHLALQYVLWENDAPPNHTAGGINMNFFPIGPIIRRTGVFFIRRTFKKNNLYKFVLQSYLDYLIERRFPLEWYLEGGRSRSGKLLPPRYGMLTYVADAFTRGKSEDVYLIPLSITYDHIEDVGAYAAEQRGERKERESFGWLVRSVRSLGRRYGDIHLRFGEPLALSSYLEQGRPIAPIDVQKIAFEVSTRINDVTPITPTALLTIALLTAEDRAFTLDQLREEVSELCEYIRSRDIPLTERVESKNAKQIESILQRLDDQGIVATFDAGPQTVYMIGSEQRLAAAYYRNTIVHFFVNAAIAELALLTAANAPVTGQEAFWDEVMRLRDLLKFEFFFADKDEFRQQVWNELLHQDPRWPKRVLRGAEEIRALLRDLRPLTSYWVLRPYLEAYQVVADALVLHPPYVEINEKKFMGECLALGRQYRLQQRIHTDESISQVLFTSAFKLAANRGLLDVDDPDCGARRRAFASEIHDVLAKIDSIAALATGRRAGF
ncbi:glycerol-3-phosphate acyltransferase [bacterium BMS3Bbin01]|nr:glycerol-3-phosphate acyltransferase [bacterium BMS3Bbin01]